MNRGVKDQFAGQAIVVDNALGFWVHRVYQASRNEMFREFHDVGEDVTPEQWAVLIRLWERDGRGQSELSEASLRDRPTMSRIVDGMETRGLLVRRKSPEDARVRTIHLTRKGRELEKKLVPIVKRIVERMVAGMKSTRSRPRGAPLRHMFENLDRSSPALRGPR